MLYGNDVGEGKIATTAGDLGIGPKIYEYGTCNDGKEKYEYLIMQRMEKTLEDVYPYQPKLFIKAIQKYQELQDAGIFQQDLKVNNIMLDAKGKLYIVDYGIAILKPKVPKADRDKNLKINTNLLLDTAFFGGYEYGTQRIWGKDKEPNKMNQYVHVAATVSKFLREQKIIHMPIPGKELDYDDLDYITVKLKWRRNGFEKILGDKELDDKIWEIMLRIANLDMKNYKYIKS